MTEQAGVWLDAETLERVRWYIRYANASVADKDTLLAILDAAEARAGAAWERGVDEDGNAYIDAGRFRLWCWDTGTVYMISSGGADMELPAAETRAVALAILHLATAAGTGGAGRGGRSERCVRILIIP